MIQVGTHYPGTCFKLNDECDMHVLARTVTDYRPAVQSPIHKLFVCQVVFPFFFSTRLKVLKTGFPGLTLSPPNKLSSAKFLIASFFKVLQCR